MEPVRDEANVPAYWIRPAQVLSGDAGMHRFVWDLHYARPAGMQASFPIAAVYRNTARQPSGVWAHPGTYTVTLTVAGRTRSQPLTVRMDPRVKTLPAALQRQFTLSKRLSDAMDAVTKGNDPDMARVRAALLSAYNLLQGADVAPTSQTIGAAADALAASRAALAKR